MLLLLNNIIVLTFTVVIGIITAFFYVPFLLFKIGFAKIFTSRERTSPPKCLQNSRWGQHNYMTLDGSGLKMHYVEKGDKDKTLMLFLHGFPEFWYSWRNQIEHHSSKYWCVAPDLRGYGETDKPKGMENYTLNYLVDDVKDLIHGLGRTECILVGHDWGGAVGYAFSAKYNDMVKAFITINMPHPLSHRRELENGLEQKIKSWYIIFFQCPVVPEFLLSLGDLGAFDNMFQDAGLTDKPCASEDLEAYKYMFQDKHTWNCTLNYYRAAMQIPSKDIAERMKNIKVPVYSIFGTDDEYLSVSCARGSKDFCQDFKETLLHDVKHWSPMQVPDEINNLIEQYLAERSL